MEQSRDAASIELMTLSIDSDERMESGGLGGGTLSKSDLRIVGAAIRQRWAIPDTVKQTLPATLETIANKGESDRDRIAAARVIVAMESQNQADDHMEAKTERLDEGKPTEIVVTYKEAATPQLSRFSDDFD